MCDVIPLSCGTITVIIPRWGPRSKHIILDVRFKISNAEMSNVVRRLEGRVRKARAQPTRELGDLSTSQKFPNGLLPSFAFGRVIIARVYCSG